MILLVLLMLFCAAGARAQDPQGDGAPPAWRGDEGGSTTARTNRPPLFRERWPEADRRLQELRRDFDQSEARREKLLDELAIQRQQYKPGKLDPAGVIAYKAIDRILGQLHRVIDQGRHDATEAGRIVQIAIATRNLWEPRLRQDLAQNMNPQGVALTPPERERRQLWLDGLKRLDSEGDEGFARALLGEVFGPMALEAAPEPAAPPLAGGPFGHRGRMGGPFVRQLAENVRQRWIERLDRMEQRQEDLAQELERQKREIERMRRLLRDNKEDNAAPSPGPSAPAKP